MSQNMDDKYIPGWLRQLEGWEETPDWLLNLIQEGSESLSFDDLDGALSEIGGEVFDAAAEQAPPPREDQEPELDAADWAAEFEVTQQEAPQQEPPALEGTPEADTGWLNRFDQVLPEQEAPAEQAEPQSPELEQAPEEEETLDWLSGLQDLIEADQEADQKEAEAPAAERAPLAEEEPVDWLSRFEEDAAIDDVEPQAPDLSAEQEAAETEPEEVLPFGDEEVPDWMLGLEEGTSSLQELLEETPEPEDALAAASELPEEASQEQAAPEEVIQPAPPEKEDEMPAWVADLDRAQEPQVEGPVAADKEHAPPEEGPPAQRAPEEGVPEWFDDAQAGLPSWLAEETDFVDEGPADTAPAAPQAEREVPDWLLGTEGDIPAEAAPVLEEQETEREVPDWLLGAEGDTPVEAAPVLEEQETEREVPDWLLSAEGDAPVEAAPAPEAEEAEREVPDWLVEAEGGTPAQGAPEEDGVPEWLVGIDADLPPLEGAFEEEADRSSVPEWLADIGEQAAAKAPPSIVPEADEAEADQAPVEEDSGKETSAGETLVEPASEVEAPQEPPVTEEPDRVPEQAAPIEEEEGELPDWLADIGEVDAEQWPADEEEDAVGAASWLDEIEETSVPELEASDELEDEGAAPDWLREAEAEQAEAFQSLEQDQDEPEREVPDWLREDQVEGELSSFDPAAPEQETEQPSWLDDLRTLAQESPSIQDALILPDQDELPEGEAPDWLEALRSQDLERTRPVEREQEPEPEGVVETSGPLIGLRNVLNPEPLLAILPKAAYKPVSPIPPAHQAEAEQLEAVLATPEAYVGPAPRSPGRQILDSLGRWGLYLAVVVVMMFAPLQSWIRVPDAPGPQSFYNRIEGAPAGGIALLVIDYDTSLDGELTPLARAVIWHLFQNQVNIAAVSTTPQGPALANGLFGERPEAVPGQNYVNLGYLPAHPAALHAFMANPLSGAALYQPPPEMTAGGFAERITDWNSFDLIVLVSGDQVGVRWWIEQVGSQGQADIVAGVSAAIAPYIRPYYDEAGTGQITGILPGVAAVSQYEDIAGAGFVPSARENFVVQANVQLLLVGVVLLCGIRSLLDLVARRRDRGGGKA